MKEKLAQLAHEQWSGWINYMFSKCTKTVDGELTIPKWAVDRWQRQAKAPYSELSIAEMDSDRKEADKFLAIFQAELKAKEEEIERLKKFWRKHHPWEDAEPTQKSIKASNAIFGNWYWFPKLKQWAQRCDGHDESDGRPLFFGPNDFAKRVLSSHVVFPMR